PALAAPLHARHTQLPYGGHRLHRRQASLGVCHRTTGPALCRPFTFIDQAPQPAATRYPMTSPRYLIPLALCICLAILAGCSTPKKTGGSGSAVTTRGGGYYKDDGPGSNIPPDLEQIPDAVPRIETHAPANF